MLTTNAGVDVSGAGKAAISMGGGELSGSLSGVSDVSYYGVASEETIQVSGMSKVKHRK